MTVYKGFQKGLICRGYQFHLGKNVTEKADCGEKGFHCAEDPETGKSCRSPWQRWMEKDPARTMVR